MAALGRFEEEVNSTSSVPGSGVNSRSGSDDEGGELYQHASAYLLSGDACPELRPWDRSILFSRLQIVPFAEVQEEETDAEEPRPEVITTFAVR